MRSHQELAATRFPTSGAHTMLVREQHSERYFQLHIGRRRVISFSAGAFTRLAENANFLADAGRQRRGPFATVGRAAAITLVACATLAAVVLTNFRAEAQHPSSLTIGLLEPVAAPARLADPGRQSPMPGAGVVRASDAEQPRKASVAIPQASNGELDLALSAAFATGEFQEWTDGHRGLGGMVVVGAAEQTALGSCRDVAILTRGMSDSGHTENSRQCLGASGRIVRANTD